MKSIAINLDSNHLFSSPTLETVNRVTGEGDDVRASEATGTDCLHALMGTEATYPRACVATRRALDEIARKPDETIAAAGDRRFS